MLSSGRHVQGQNAPQVGYAVLTSDAGTPVPVGAELLSYTNSSGVLLSQAAVGSVEPIRSGRIFVDEVGTRTAIALANPSSQVAAGTWILRDDSGAQVGAVVPLALGARQHIAVYVSQLFSNRPADFRGSLTFESNQPLAAVTLRESTNAQGEP